MYERLLITFVIMVFFAVVLILMKRRQIVAANRASQQLKKSSRIPSIVYFWSAGCPVCKMTQKRVLEGILAEYGTEQLAFTAYNTDDTPDVAKEWGVMTLPTTFVLDSTGAIQHVNNGLAVPETLRRQLGPLMKKESGANVNDTF